MSLKKKKFTVRKRLSKNSREIMALKKKIKNFKSLRRISKEKISSFKNPREISKMEESFQKWMDLNGVDSLK